jgi:single-strand DNA-binding protein
MKETNMKDLNKILLIGRLGNDPVRRETKSGLAVAHFSLATSRKVPEGPVEEGVEPTLREETDWHNIVVWGRQAEVCFQYLRKGRTIYVEGSIRKRTYTGKDGQLKVNFEVHADSVRFLSSLGGSASAQDQADEVVESEVAAS